MNNPASTGVVLRRALSGAKQNGAANTLKDTEHMPAARSS